MFTPFALATTLTILFLLLFGSLFELSISVRIALGFIPALSLLLTSFYVQVFVGIGSILAIYFHWKHKNQK